MVMKQVIKSGTAATGLIIVILFLIVGFFGPWLSPYDPMQIDMNNMLQTPSRNHILGTDELGRDILSRIISGTKYSVVIVIFPIAIGITLGISIGTIAGYYGRRLETFLMRLIDMLLAFPGVILAIMIITIIGIDLKSLIIALGIASVPRFARVSRSSVLMVKENEYVEAAELMGENDWNIIIRYILPNACGPIFVDISLRAAQLILLGSGLSFLGLGIQPPTPEWGSMIAAGRNYLQEAGHIIIFPGIAVYIIATGFNLLGDGLRDALDPRVGKSLV